MAKFKAIIIGGSVAGLTLAHAFEKCGIDYVLLEARDTFSPQLGAGIVIMPNGARILDQMGLLDAIENFVSKIKRGYVRRKGEGDDKAKMISWSEWPMFLEEQLGYPFGYCGRRDFLLSLYDQLENKTKLLLGRKLVQVVQRGDSVTVKCADGSSYEGDIVVGADGVHSKTRQEMLRHAEETGAKGIVDGEKNRITAEYTCIYGLSSPMSLINIGDYHITFDIDKSGILFVTKDGLPHWLLFSKMPQCYIGHENSPRFTREQMEAKVKEHEDFPFTSELTLKELFKTSHRLGYFPLEEGVHQIWTCGRVVCLGDAIHKMTPNMGQGGNQAIESAATLTNCLKTMLQGSTTRKPTTTEIESSLKRFQDIRQKRVAKIFDLSAAKTRYEALETLDDTLRLLYMTPPSGEMIADFKVDMMHTAPYLEFLAQPARTLQNRLWLEGKARVRAGDNIPSAKL